MSGRKKAVVIQNPNHVINGVAIKATVENQKVATGPVSVGILGNRTTTTNISVSRIAAGMIGKYRVVSEVANGRISIPGTIESDTGLLGITTNVANNGDTLDVMIVGEIYDPAWHWSLGSVYAGDMGTLSQEGAAQSLRRVGIAVSPTTILVDMREGARGQNTVLSGEGVPQDSQGNQGDYYLNLLTYDLYGPKTTNWTISRNLIGPKGDKGEIINYFYDYPTPSTSWRVEHNLGHYPNVLIEDSAGDQIYTEISFLDINTLVVSFTYPTAGRVIVT